MIDPEVYICANAPTVAGNAIKFAIWYDTPTAQTILESTDHAAEIYRIPRIQFEQAIKRYLDMALSSPAGLKTFIKSQLWRYPKKQSIKQFLSDYWKTDMELDQIIKAVRSISI